MADDVFGAPFMQLFPEDTMEQVISTYTKVTSIPPALVVDLYCDEEHIEWRGDLNSWVDTKYTYTEDGITESLVYNMHVGGAGTKPGMQDGGSSYTTLGASTRDSLPTAGARSKAGAYCAHQHTASTGRNANGILIT